MWKTWTKAAKVRREFKAGKPRQKDLVLTPTKAMLEGCALRHELREAMRKATLPEGDVQVALILMTWIDSEGVGWVRVLPIPEIEKLPELYGKLRKIEKAENAVPLGLAIYQRDRDVPDYDPKDPKSGTVMWIQPWLVNPVAVTAQKKVKAALAGLNGLEELKERFS